jgi:hypothetical protein
MNDPERWEGQEKRGEEEKGKWVRMGGRNKFVGIHKKSELFCSSK